VRGRRLPRVEWQENLYMVKRTTILRPPSEWPSEAGQQAVAAKPEMAHVRPSVASEKGVAILPCVYIYSRGAWTCNACAEVA